MHGVRIDRVDDGGHSVHGPYDDVAWNQDADGFLRLQRRVGTGQVARAEDDLRSDLHAKLLVERGGQVDFGQDAESLSGKCLTRARGVAAKGRWTVMLRT